MSDLSPNELKLRQLDRRDQLMRTFEVVVLTVLVGLTIFSLLRVEQLTVNNQENIIEHRQELETNTKELALKTEKLSIANRARNDVQLCILSIFPTKRSPEYIKSCYDQMEKQYGIKIQRFGDGIGVQ